MPEPYEYLALHYDRVCIQPAKYEIRKVWQFYATELRKLGASTFMDVGAGTGISGRMLKRWCRCGDALEPNQYMRNTLPLALYRRCSKSPIETTHAPRKKVNIVAAAFDVFNYVPINSIRKTLTSARSMLAPEGILLFDVITQNMPSKPLKHQAFNLQSTPQPTAISIDAIRETHILYFQKISLWKRALLKNNFRLLRTRRIKTCLGPIIYEKYAFIAKAIF